MNYILEQKLLMKNDASVKPRTDISQILEEEGWNLVTLFDVTKPKFIRNIDMICNLFKLCKLQKEDIVLVQWPFELIAPFKKLRIEKFLKCKKILFVHDVQSLRLQQHDFLERARFNKYDVIVTHTQAFRSWLIESGINKPIITNELFDYKLEEKIVQSKSCDEKYRVVFSGNLDKRKSGFLYTDIEAKNYTLELYGNNYIDSMNEIINYNGVFSPDVVVKHLNGDFGLVWDGESANTCSGNFGEYLKYNCPYKCAMYIAAQLPIIIWRKAAMADFIVKNEIGFVIDSLDEIDSILSSMTEEKYDNMLEKLKTVQENVINGKYTKNFANRALELLK